VMIIKVLMPFLCRYLAVHLDVSFLLNLDFTGKYLKGANHGNHQAPPNHSVPSFSGFKEHVNGTEVAEMK